MTLPVGNISENTIGEDEMRRIVNFDETDQPLTSQNIKRRSQFIR